MPVHFKCQQCGHIMSYATRRPDANNPKCNECGGETKQVDSRKG